jgi:uncharacterized protein (UPF0276 family)
MMSPLRLTGVGLRPPHYTDFLEAKPAVAWVEVHSENYLQSSSNALNNLENIRKNYPVSLHGVGLSLGSADELNWQYLHKLKELITRLDPCLISDHLSWASINGQYLHDLLPLPYTEETLTHLVTRIKQVQDYLQRQLLIENISSYVSFSESTIPECEFINEVATLAGCGILLDVNNVYVSACNLGFDASDYISKMNASLVQEIHLAGFTVSPIDGNDILIDSHSRAVVPAVWELYRETIKLLGCKPTIVEWDDNIPSIDTLFLEAQRAETIMRESYDIAKLTG